MSQLTSFTSSADSLINASSGTAGQVLAWDVASSSFIPQNPASGDTPELPLWTANTAYLSGDTVVTNLLAAVMLRKAGSATSTSAMDATELAGWRLFSQSDYPPFTATSLVCTGFIISQGGQLWRSITNRTTNTTFDATEQANWVALTGGGSTFQSAWLTGRLAASTNTNISNGDHAKFNTIRASAGSTISLDTATAYTSGVGSSVGRITLQAGGTYKLAGHLGDIGYASNSVSNYITYSWFNADTGVEVGDKVTIASGWSSSNDWDGSGGIAEAIVAPSVNTRYELRILASSNLNSYGGGLAGGFATFNVVQLAGNLPAQNLSLTTTGSGAATYNNITGVLNVPTYSIPANTVTSSMIVDGTIVASDIASDTITATQIAPNAITASELADNSVDTNAIVDGNVTLVKLAVDSVNSSKIVDGSIQTIDIGDGQITNAKLANSPLFTIKGREGTTGVTQDLALASQFTTAGGTFAVVGNTITPALLSQIPANTLVGNPTGATANQTTITLGSNLSFSGGVLNAASGSSLPNFTNLLGLRGDGTGVPVSDSRIKYGTSGSALLELVNDGGTYAVLGNSGSAVGLNIQAVTPATTGASFTIAAQSAGGSNNSGGSVSLFAGNATGSAGSDIKFYAAPTGGTAGTTARVSGQVWTMGADALGSTLTGNNTSVNTITSAGSSLFRIGSQNAGSLSLEAFGAGDASLLTNGGNINVTSNGAGVVTIGGGGTGGISVGTNTKTTTVNGIVKKPGLSVVTFSRSASGQAIAANTSTSVIWDAAATFGNTAACATLGAGGLITLNRIGFYHIYGTLSIQSATTNLIGGVALVNGTAVLSATNIHPWRLSAVANSPHSCYFDFYVQCTTVGTFTVQVGSASAHVIVNNGGTITAPTKSIVTIKELG